MFDNASSASVDLSQLTDPASSCTTNLDDCNAELQADATLFSLYFLAIGASAGLGPFKRANAASDVAHFPLSVSCVVVWRVHQEVTSLMTLSNTCPLLLAAIFLQTYFFGVIGAMLTKRLRQASFEVCTCAGGGNCRRRRRCRWWWCCCCCRLLPNCSSRRVFSFLTLTGDGSAAVPCSPF